MGLEKTPDNEYIEDYNMYFYTFNSRHTFSKRDSKKGGKRNAFSTGPQK